MLVKGASAGLNVKAQLASVKAKCNVSARHVKAAPQSFTANQIEDLVARIRFFFSPPLSWPCERRGTRLATNTHTPTQTNKHTHNAFSFFFFFFPSGLFLPFV